MISSKQINLQTDFESQKIIGNKLYLEGIMTSSSRDLDNDMEITTPNALKKAINQFLNLPILIEHGNTQKYRSQNVGELIKLEYSPEDYIVDSPTQEPMQIKVFVVINNAEAIQDISKGNLAGFSLKWSVKNYLIDKRTRKNINTEIEPLELTLTKKPSNQDCYFKIICDDENVQKYLQKSWKYEKEIVKVKSIYKNEFDNLFCDLEYTVKQKSAYKIPIEDIKTPIFFKFKVIKKPICFKFKVVSLKHQKK